MTPTEKQKTLSEQSVYGDLMGYDLKDAYYSKNPSTIVGFQGQLVYIGCDLNKVEAIKPILRPLSDLTKEISHKGYNDDKPFIPLVELAKIIKPNFKSYELNVNNQEVLCLIEGHSRRYELYLFDSKEILLEESDLLNRLHFDVRGLIPSNEAISTDEVNPYEVK